MERGPLVERLKDCGLSAKEAEVYLELIMGGPGKASEVARRVNLSRMDAYNQLRRLADRGIVRATVEKPMRFVPLSIDDAIRSLIDERKETIRRIEAHQEFLEEHVQPAPMAAPVVADATFRIHQDRRTIYAQIRKMIQDAKQEVLVAATRRSIGRYAGAGVIEALRVQGASDVKVRVMTQVGEDNVEAVMEALSDGAFGLRHSDRVGSNLVIVDGMTILNSLVFDDAPGSKGKGDVAVWTDSKDFVLAQKSFFEEAWDESTPLAERVTELRTGRVVEPIKAYLGEGSMYEKWRTLVRDHPEGRPDVALHLLRQGTTYSLREFGIEIAHVFNLIGHRIGQEVAHDLVATSPSALWTELAGLWEREGFGLMSKLSKKQKHEHGIADEPGPVLRVERGFSPRAVTEVDRPLCSLDEGVLAGIIETSLGRGCRVHERACTGQGDAACLFVVRYLDAAELARLEAERTAHATVFERDG